MFSVPQKYLSGSRSLIVCMFFDNLNLELKNYTKIYCRIPCSDNVEFANETIKILHQTSTTMVPISLWSLTLSPLKILGFSNKPSYGCVVIVWGKKLKWTPSLPARTSGNLSRYGRCIIKENFTRPGATIIVIPLGRRNNERGEEKSHRIIRRKAPEG